MLNIVYFYFSSVIYIDFCLCHVFYCVHVLIVEVVYWSRPVMSLLNLSCLYVHMCVVISTPNRYTNRCLLITNSTTRWRQFMPRRRLTLEYFLLGAVRSFLRSLLRAGVQPTLDPSAETFMSVQCARPGRGGELVGVWGVCASCVGWRKG